HLRGVVLLEVKDGVADPVFAEGDLVVGLFVHEDVVVAVLVQVLELARLQVGDLDLVFGFEPPRRHRAGLEVLQLQVDVRAPAAGRVQIAIDDEVELAVVADDDLALANVAVVDRCHEALRWYTEPAPWAGKWFKCFNVPTSALDEKSARTWPGPCAAHTAASLW